MPDFLDEATLAEMEKSEKKPRGRTKTVVHTAPDVTDSHVWVKCVSELRPFATGNDGQPFPLEYWGDYKIPKDEAVLLHDRQMVVILKPKGE